MNYEDLNIELSKQFPMLKWLVEMEMDTFDCYLPGPHVLYSNVLNPYVKRLLEEEKDLHAIRQVFSFFELLACSEDEEVRNLLQVTLLEALWEDKLIYDRALQYMHSSTKILNSTIGDYLKAPSI